MLRALAHAAALALVVGNANAAPLSAAVAQKSPDASSIQARLDAKGSARVIVMYNSVAGGARARLGTALENIPQVASDNYSAQDAILRDHLGEPSVLSSNGRGLTRMTITPAFAINATSDELDALAADPRVASIEIDGIGEPNLIQSVPLIGMVNAYASNATGQGFAVAVLDTGVETGHTFLTGKTVAEGCFSTTQGVLGGGGSASLCPGGASSSTAAGSGANCNITWDGCFHGTHVAGIAVGLNSLPQSGQPPNGVAKNASLIPIKMYSEFTGTDCTSAGFPSPCVFFFFSDFIRGLDYLYAIRDSLPGGVRIAAANLSGGGGHFSPNCDNADESPAMKFSIDRLRAAGIATVASAGNGASRTQIGQPACISSVVAVAASTKSDAIASYTDISTQVSVFAPGSSILSSVPAGFVGGDFGYNCNYTGPAPVTGGSYCFLSGTSMASPTVAGAFAAIRSVCPNATVDDVQNALASTGTPIADTRLAGTLTKNRIRVDLALQQLGCAAGGGGPPAIVSPPPGSTLTTTTVTFTGGHTANDLQHWIYVGNVLGGNTLLSQDLGIGHSMTVSGLPSSGAIYVRFWTRFAAGWQFTDQQYTMNAPATFNYALANGGGITVTAGSSGSTSVTATLSAGATQAVSFTASGLPSGATAGFNGASCSPTCSTTITVTTTSSTLAGTYPITVTGSPLGRTTSFNLVVNPAAATAPAIVTPTPGSTLTSTTVTFTGGHTANDIQHVLSVGTSPGGSNLFKQVLGMGHSATVSNLPQTGTIYVRYSTWLPTGLKYTDQQYTMNVGGGGASFDYALSGASNVTVTAGSSGSTTITATLSAGATQAVSFAASGLPAGASAGFNAASCSPTCSTSLTVTTASSTPTGTFPITVTGSPLGRTTSFNLVVNGTGSTVPAILSPTPGSTLTSTTVTFTGGHTANDIQHWLYVGTSPGGSNLFNQILGSGHSATVSNLPKTGTLYVRFSTWLPSGIKHTDQQYTMAVP